MKKLLTALSLSAALLIPVCAVAQDHHDDRDHRYYDKSHKDYHEWNANEDKAWHMYWEQRHHAYIDWDRASEAQRQAYWRWRHEHSDALLQINIH